MPWRHLIAFTSFALVALGEGVLLAHRPPPQIVERVVVVREPVTVPAPLPVVPPPETRVVEAPESLPIERSLSLGQTPYERLLAKSNASVSPTS